MKLVNLRCENCGAELEIDLEKNQAFCSYCGSKHMLQDDSVRITKHIIDEARLKEAELRMKELEYAHEKELREETLREEQKKAFRTALILYFAAIIVTYAIPGTRTVASLIFVFGGAALLSMRKDDQRNSGVDGRYSYSPKNKFVALAMCLFLGVFGAHYFYVGRKAMGIAYLFTLGMFGIGWMIDIVRIACGTFRDNNGLVLY